MEKQFEGVFNLFDLKVRRLRNGNKLCLVFETAEDLEIEKKLIEFRGKSVKAVITQAIQPEKKSKIITIEEEFEVFEIECRRLRNGNKLRLVMEQFYTKNAELIAVSLRYEDCKIFFTEIEQELGLEVEQEDEFDDL